MEIQDMEGILIVKTEVDFELDRLQQRAVAVDLRLQGARKLHRQIEKLISSHLSEYPADLAYCGIYRGPNAPLLQQLRADLLSCLIEIEHALDRICGHSLMFGYCLDTESLEQYVVAGALDQEEPARAYLQQRLARDEREIATARERGIPQAVADEI